MNQKLVTGLRIAAYWTLFSMFASGLAMTNALLWAPWILTHRFMEFGWNLMNVIIQTPPYSWMNVSVEQLLVIGSIVDILGMLTLLVAPKTAAVMTMVLTGWRQVLVRVNFDRLPNSPMCDYEAPYCTFNGVLYLITLVSSILVFTARKPMVETHLHMLKLLGIRTRRTLVGGPTLVGSPRKTD